MTKVSLVCSGLIILLNRLMFSRCIAKCIAMSNTIIDSLSRIELQKKRHLFHYERRLSKNWWGIRTWNWPLWAKTKKQTWWTVGIFLSSKPTCSEKLEVLAGEMSKQRTREIRKFLFQSPPCIYGTTWEISCECENRFSPAFLDVAAAILKIPREGKCFVNLILPTIWR